eukprot:g19019.t1
MASSSSCSSCSSVKASASTLVPVFPSFLWSPGCEASKIHELVERCCPHLRTSVEHWLRIYRDPQLLFDSLQREYDQSLEEVPDDSDEEVIKVMEGWAGKEDEGRMREKPRRYKGKLCEASFHVFLWGMHSRPVTRHRPSSRPSERVERSQVESPKEAVNPHQSLSFVDLTLEDIHAAIIADAWRENSAVLLGAAAPEFRCMQNRTLGFWAKSFQRWQLLRKQQELQMSDRCTVGQLEKVFQGFARPRCLELGKLFGGLRSLSGVSFEKTSVSLAEIFTAGVLMSEIISSTNKLRFVFGMVDTQGRNSLSQKDGCAFGLCMPSAGKEEQKAVPTRGSWSSLLLQRRHSSAWISRKVARTIVKLHSSLQNDVDRAAVVAAIKARQASSEHPAATGQQEQRLPFPVLLDWCFRLVQDPLAIPYALAIERFCPRETSADDNPENFEVDEEQMFHLSPGGASAPDEREAEAAQYMPSRADVLAARSRPEPMQ